MSLAARKLSFCFTFLFFTYFRIYSALLLQRDHAQLHHDRHHHLAYVNGANAALEKLESGRKNGWNTADIKSVERDLSFNLAGHVLHSVFWPNMKPRR
jgi:superoxide dismutase